MDELQERLTTLKQMRLTEARSATGERDDPATIEFIRLHAAVLAIEAAIADGASDRAEALDLTGFELGAKAFEPDVGADAPQPVLELEAAMRVPLEDFSFWEAYVTYQGRHPWFATWAAAVEMGGYRTRVLMPSSPR
jgi:hypothetical protein